MFRQKDLPKKLSIVAKNLEKPGNYYFKRMIMTKATNPTQEVIYATAWIHSSRTGKPRNANVLTDLRIKTVNVLISMSVKTILAEKTRYMQGS